LKPAKDCPDAIFLSDVGASGTKTLFTANVDLFGIEEVAEEFPAGWGFIVSKLKLLSDTI